MATSPVPPSPLWQAEMIAASTGCMRITKPVAKPVAIMPSTVTAQTTKYPGVSAMSS